MMEDSKSLLVYLFGLAGLVLGSILFTGRIEPLPLEPLPPARPAEVAQEGCSTNSERNIFYIPDPTSLEPNRLLISGTVYASDLVTPLPDALLEVLLVVKESYYPPYEAFHDWLQTDEAGYYEATIPKSDHYGIIYLYYRANDQDDCPLKLQLFFIDEPALGDAVLVSKGLMKLGLEQTEITGSVLRGSIDVALPIPPSVSFRADLIPPEVAGEPLTISGVVYAADGETPLPDVRVEVWQTNPAGFYDGYDYLPTSFNLGGQMRTDAASRYEFTTLKPGPIKVDQTYLPAQIHFKVSYQDQKPFFTRLFFADDPFLNNLLPLPEQAIRLTEQGGPTGPVWQGNFDVILPVSPAVP